MKFLIVGDIVGRPGLDRLKIELKKRKDIDFCIVNGENSASGRGLRRKEYDEIIKRLERIENLLKPLEEDTSYGKKILANILGNVIWEWLSYGTKDSIIHPPKL